MRADSAVEPWPIQWFVGALTSGSIDVDERATIERQRLPVDSRPSAATDPCASKYSRGNPAIDPVATDLQFRILPGPAPSLRELRRSPSRLRT